ncbi:alpha/beta fold hydrolase [Lentzea jiangxiensis]|uniref:Pimeloyl-ACP methyl ester carboxylesterase n=1 Tax=Lentzea jiangxiensis TaxID=641025 RepID=A0A1H0X494_9PSEU|nr:alpha/beta fold hydrolase [Lentzea jiangxiensis]SDP97555.1 Pimeloyl-ACP methyl ester carboxylesterase [Lentzea jiangxiensis]
MTVVLVHGNPETDAIWGPLAEALGRDDVVCLSPPGFGAELPADFPATHLAYRDWLEAELARLGEPVHLVGHDCGGFHIVNVAMHRPELVRSWVSDVVGVFDEDYVWHDAAQIWRTPGAGEEFVAAMSSSTVEERAAKLGGVGMSADIATAVARHQGPVMGRAILALYRSLGPAALAEARRDLDQAAARPGLAILATEDTYVGSETSRRRAARRAGARVEVLDGLGHWWMMQDPVRSAEMLTHFWESVE